MRKLALALAALATLGIASPMLSVSAQAQDAKVVVKKDRPVHKKIVIRERHRPATKVVIRHHRHHPHAKVVIKERS